MLFSFDFLGPCFHSVRFQVFVINGPGFFSLDRKAFSFGFSGLLGVRYRVFAINGPGFFFTWSESVLIWFFRAPVFIVYVIGFSSSMGRAFFHLVGECSHLVFPGPCFHSVRYRVFAINGPGLFFTWSESVLIWFSRAPVFIVCVIGFSSSFGWDFFFT